MHRRSPAVGLSVSVLFVFAALVVSAQAVSAQADSKRWPALKEHYFGDRPIHDGAGAMALLAPERAFDAALVPVTVRARFPQSAERYVKTITLVIDENPAPLAGRFHLGPASGTANISTRVRVNDYTHIRAIAELNDGSLHMVKRFVRASGGCSAPAPKDVDATLARMGKMKLRRSQNVIFGQPNRAKLLISHPNYSGMQMDASTHEYIPAEFVQSIEVRYGKDLVMTVESSFSLSEDPSLSFDYVPSSPGEMEVFVTDTAKRQFSKRWDDRGTQDATATIK